MNYFRRKARDVIIAKAPGIYHKFKAGLNYQLAKYDNRIEEKWDKYAGGAYDVKEADPRDIQFEEIASSETTDIPRRFIMDDGHVQDQGRSMLCVGYGGAGGNNEAEHLLKTGARIGGKELSRHIYNKFDKDIYKEGTLVVNAPKALKDLGLIHSYYQVNTHEQIKRALYYGCPVLTGTNKISWSKTSKGAVAVIGAGEGHFINIKSYDDDLTRTDGFGKTYTGFYIVENTWGTDWGDNGNYYLPYDIADKVLFNTKKAIIKDKDAVAKRTKKLVENIEEKLYRTDNKYYYLLEPYIKNGYNPIFKDHFEKGELSAGEIKTLIEINNVKK